MVPHYPATFGGYRPCDSVDMKVLMSKDLWGFKARSPLSV